MTSPPTPNPVRDALLAQAEKPAAELVPVLIAAQAAAMAALEGLSEAQARFKPAPAAEQAPDDEDAWCIAELLRHLIQSEGGNAVRIPLLARGEGAAGPTPGALGGHESTPLADLIEALRAADARMVETARALDGSERTDATALHPAFGPLNCRAWLALYTVHLRAHLRQIADVKAAAGYPA